ncbi:MAG: hydroxypyruvate isomerase family protein [Acidimicrobiales bacterium]
MMSGDGQQLLRFSANLGFLWTDRPLPDAIDAAHGGGFDAVECHAPFAHDVSDVATALRETGLPILSLNARPGSLDGDMGLLAVPGRESEALTSLHEAIDYAAGVGCPRVNLLAGRTGRTAAAEAVYRSNLEVSAAVAAESGVTLVIEPLNTDYADDYHLVDVDRAVETIAAVGAPNLRLLFDCFHVQRMHGEILSTAARAIDLIEHVQFAGYPDRSEPDNGNVDYHAVLPAIAAMGYRGAFGAEYCARRSVEEGLDWMNRWREREDSI